MKKSHFLTKEKLLKLFSFPITLILKPSSVYAMSATNELTRDTLNDLDPLQVAGSPNVTTFSSPVGIINVAMEFAFPIAGLILFVMLVWGGFQMLSTAATKKSMDAGRQRIEAAIIGFILLFISYWIVRILEIIFGVEIL